MRSKSNLALILFLLMGFVVYCPTASSQTLKRLYLHASVFEPMPNSNEEFSTNSCGRGMSGALFRGAADLHCIAHAPLTLPVGTVITKVSPTWRDPGVSCELYMRGYYLIKSSGYRTFALPKTSEDSTKPVLASPYLDLVDSPPSSPQSYMIDDEATIYDNAYYYLLTIIDGEAYNISTNPCYLAGVSIDYYDVE